VFCAQIADFLSTFVKLGCEKEGDKKKRKLEKIGRRREIHLPVI
jgi:hypothetical protein